MVISILVLVVILYLSLSGGEGKASVIVCNSISCGWNKRCRCTRKEVVVYDNVIVGLCLHHTGSMEDRILEPMKKGRLLDRYGHETHVAVGALKKAQRDREGEDLIKNPNAFSKWMKKHLR